MAIFTGAGVAIVTPFNEDGSINYDRLDELIEFHCAHKTDSIVICGTTGESATMTEEEHMQCVKFTIDRVNKRVPVIAGTGSNCTRTAIDMSKEASEYGADGLLLVIQTLHCGGCVPGDRRGRFQQCEGRDGSRFALHCAAVQ